MSRIRIATKPDVLLFFIDNGLQAYMEYRYSIYSVFLLRAVSLKLDGCSARPRQQKEIKEENKTTRTAEIDQRAKLDNTQIRDDLDTPSAGNNKNNNRPANARETRWTPRRERK